MSLIDKPFGEDKVSSITQYSKINYTWIGKFSKS